MGVVAMAAALIFLTAIQSLHAQEKSSLTDFESSSSRVKLSISHVEVLDPCVLQEKLVLAEHKNKLITNSLIQANLEAEVLRKQNKILVEKFDALSLDSPSCNQSSIESKLLNSLGEIRLLKDKANKANDAIIALSESLEVLLKTSTNINPQSRMSVEIEMRKASSILNSFCPNKVNDKPIALSDAVIIDVQEDLELVVANIGSISGVKLGMSFSILRNEKKIATACVIDVRENISGATIQNLTSENIQVENGDILQADLNK
ncbi:MAG: hypothetical protein WCG52_00120 [bacterium]